MRLILKLNLCVDVGSNVNGHPVHVLRIFFCNSPDGSRAAWPLWPPCWNPLPRAVSTEDRADSCECSPRRSSILKEGVTLIPTELMWWIFLGSKNVLLIDFTLLSYCSSYPSSKKSSKGAGRGSDASVEGCVVNSQYEFRNLDKSIFLDSKVFYWKC